MHIKIRKEKFGYVFFDRWQRTHHFVNTNEKLEYYSRPKLLNFLSNYYNHIDESTQYSFIFPYFTDIGLSAPVGMYLEISEKCNLSCEHCYQPTNENEGAMSTDQIFQLINDLASLGVFEIRLCGKEAPVHKDFVQIAQHIRQLNLFYGLNTNAYYSDIKQNEIISTQPDYVVISLDGDEKFHDQIRKTGSYRKVLKFLDKLSTNKVKTRINTVVSKSNLDSLDHIAKIAENFNCGISFLPFRSIGKNSNFKTKNKLDKHTMFSIVKKISILRKQYPKVSMITYFDILDNVPNYHHSISVDAFNKPCPARKNGFITHKGEFFPCDFLRHWGERFYCGNILTESLFKIWYQSSTLKAFQEMRHPSCEDCSFYLTKCNGGCFCEALQAGKLDDNLCFVDLIEPDIMEF